ncbi:MAG: amidohydrolase [Jatrophihabitantaceae bacterium]
MLEPGYVDVHQHLWPAELLDALRRRTAPPMLRGWTLHTAGEPPFEVRPDDHDPAARQASDRAAARVLVSLSSPLGIEALHPDEAQPLLAAWNQGVLGLPHPFAGWAAVASTDPDADGLKGLFDDGLCGLQVPAPELATPAGVERWAPVLRQCEQRDRPVLVHPGPVIRSAPDLPDWWAAVVDYPAQLQAAWWAWRQAGRALLPDLRICFVAGAGLAPLHHERFAARGGGRSVVDRNAFVDTSSYGRRAVDGLIRALGIDVIALGSDRPYARPFTDPHLGDAAHHALRVVNPTRLLEGERQ